MGVLFALAIATGSIGNVLSLVMHLKNGKETLPANAQTFFERLQKMETELKLSIPLPGAIAGDFAAKLAAESAKNEEKPCTSVTSDGSHLFIWDGNNGSISKVGTGFHGTIAGNEYAVNSDVCEHLQSYLGGHVYALSTDDEGNSSSAGTAADGASAPGNRMRIRLTGEGRLLEFPEGTTDFRNAIEEMIFEENEVEEGFEVEVLRTEEVLFPGREAAVTAYFISETSCILSSSLVANERSENSASEEDEDRSEQSEILVEVVDVISNETSGSSSSGGSGSRLKSFQPACLAVASGKLYLWMRYMLGPFRVAVFSTSALKLEDVIDVHLPVPEIVRARESWERKRAVGAVAESDAMDESKEEDDLQEEKVGDAGDARAAPAAEQSAGGEPLASAGEDQEEEVVETRLGAEKVLTATAGTCSVFSVSTRGEEYVDADLSASLCGVADLTQAQEVNFVFADGDENQEIVLDLGALYAPGRFGAKFKVAGEGEERPVHERFEVLVSVNNIEFIQWGVVEGPSEATKIFESAPADVALPADIRYVKYRFGKCTEGGLGSAIIQLFATGFSRVKVEPEVPMPVMCSDGRLLYFINAKTKSKKEKDAFLQLIAVDPLQHMSVKTDVVTNVDTTEERLHQSSFATNGEFIIMSHRDGFSQRAKSDKEVQFCFTRLNILSAKEAGSSKLGFSSATGYPVAISYDARNNIIWSWDSVDRRVLRWRNAGYAPRFQPPRGSTAMEMLLSESPALRLEALEALRGGSERTAAYEAAFILCHVDRIADLHGPPVVAMAESKCYDEVEVAAAGYEDGNYCKLLFRGQICGESKRGFNFLVLTDGAEVYETRTFDTHDSESASERMADFIESIPDGRVVLVGTMDSANDHLTSRGISALKSLGAERLEKLTFRGSFAMIGRKGASSSAVVQTMVDKKNGPAVVRQRLPCPRIPLAVDTTPETLKSLVGLITTHYALFKNKEATDIDKVMLLTCIRLCTTNVYHLLRGNPSEEIAKYFSAEERKAIIDFVMDMIDTSPDSTDGGFAIAKAALRLFITSIDVLYVSAADKCSLLIKYLTEFVSGTLSVLEKSVLELLLRQMSSAASLAKILSAQDATGLSDPALLMASLASIAEKETILKMQRLVGSGDSYVSSGVGDAAVQMLATLSNMILSQGVQDFISSPSSNATTSAGAVRVVKVVSNLSEISLSLLRTALQTNDELSAVRGVDSSEEGKLDEEIDEILKSSPVGALLPVVLFTVSRLANSGGSKLVDCGAVGALSENLSSCLASLEKLIAKIPKKKLIVQKSVDSTSTKSATKTVESAHPYASNTDQVFEVSFPGAIKITIVFDEESKTENNYDWVKLFKDSSKTETWHPSIEKFTGRGGSENWPGFGGRAPLVIEGDALFVEFHSDGSNEDWGWRFVATAEFRRTASSAQTHWCLDLERELASCGANVASCMIKGVAWNAQLESPNVSWMVDDMMTGYFRKPADGLPESEEQQFLVDLVDRKTPLAQECCRKMKARVMEDRGQVEDINKAVYATAAALIKHNGLTAEALALAKGNRDKPSDALIKVWKASQKMRSYFELADVRVVQSVGSSVDNPLLRNPSVSSSKPAAPAAAAPAPEKKKEAEDDDDMPPLEMPSLVRVPSLYSGAGADAVRGAAQAVVARCLFLVRIDLEGDDSLPAAPALVRKPSSGWKLAAKLVTQKQKSGRSLTEDNKSEDKWHAVVGAAQITNKLKEMLSYRRMAAQRKDGEATITERVLNFVQSNVVVEHLEEVRKIRDVRCDQRAAGLDLVNRLISADVSPFCVTYLVSCVQLALSEAQNPENAATKVHYLNAIEGCSPTNYGAIASSFSNFIRNNVEFIISTLSKLESAGAEEKGLLKSAIMSCLRALAFDYDTVSHNILESSRIIPMLESLTRADDKDMRTTAWSLFELLLLRCAGVGSNKVELGEPSDFTNKIVSFLVAELTRVTTAPKQVPQPKPDAAEALSKYVPAFRLIGDDAVVCDSGSIGLSSPHVPLSLQSSFSLWINRKRGQHEDAVAAGEPAEGMSVIRGPDWQASAGIEDGNSHVNIGKIVNVNKAENKVTVKWASGPNKTYLLGANVQGEVKYEVVLADPTIGGQIYTKGSAALLPEAERDAPWSSFGLLLTPDARLNFIANCSADDWFENKSVSRIPPDEWTHVCIVLDKAKHMLFINGELDREDEVPSDMLYPGVKEKNTHIVESRHPYSDNMDEYTPVEVEGATSYTITFDAASKTEQNYDYVRFYKDDR